MRAASQLRGRGPTDVDDVVHVYKIKLSMMMIVCYCFRVSSVGHRQVRSTTSVLETRTVSLTASTGTGVNTVDFKSALLSECHETVSLLLHLVQI